MQPIELTLRRDPERARLHRPQGFALVIDGSVTLSDEIGVALAKLAGDPALQEGRFYLLPKSSSDVSASGLVWITGAGAQRVDCPPGAIALKPLFDESDNQPNVWIPQDCQLWPRVDGNLLARKLTMGTLTRVWLPATGLVGLEPHDQLRPADWLRPPESENVRAWSTPPETVSLPTRLVELGMQSPPTAQEFMREVAGEIGNADWSLFESDPTGENTERPGALSRLQRWMLAKLDELAGRGHEDDDSSGQDDTAKGSGAGAGMMGKAMSSIASAATAPMVAAMSRLLQGQRDQQIEKLLQMMKTNPDQALKFAIPVGAIGAAFRGLAMPGSRLLARLTDFSLSGLGGGGGPVDFWNIDYNLQIKLQQQYREQANREIAAGRYRRAAYIYAHLLSDFRGAAMTLEKGKYFHEAAVLYRDKLNNKTDAARCLTQAGQFQDAADLYWSMNKFEEAGEVWLEAGVPEKAEKMFRSAFQQQLAKGAVVSAANILDQRLDARGEAVSLLQRQWPEGRDMVRCAELAITWLGEDGNHEETQKFIETIIDSASEHQMIDVAAITRNAANKYPDNQIRLLAEDLCRLSVSRAIRDGSMIERGEALSTLAILDNDDLQLRRDATGYGRRIRQRDVKRSPASKKLSLTRLDEFVFRGSARYLDYLVDGSEIYAMGIYGSVGEADYPVNALQVSRIADLQHPKQQRKKFAKLQVSADGLEVGDVFFVHGSKLSAYAPIEQDFVTGVGVNVLPKRDVVAAVADGDRVWELCADETITLRDGTQTYGLTAHWLEIWDEFGLPATPDGSPWLSICLSGDIPVIALDSYLFALRRGQIDHLTSVRGSRIHDMASSMPHTMHRVAVAHTDGLDVVATQVGERSSVCQQRGYTLCEWSHNGHYLLAYSSGYLYCFQLRNSTYAKIAEIHVPQTEDPVKLLRMAPDIVALGYRNGCIKRFQLSQ